MLSNKIKEATKTAHQQLEKKVVLQLKAIRSNADYAALLKKFYAYFSKVEKAITPFITPELLPDYKDRRNTTYLKKDIEELGFTIDELPAATAPEISGTLQALGALYVMEGSIMGGNIIVQLLAKGGMTQGISFFSGYGPATGEMWGKFIAVLNRQATTPEAEAAAIQAANETFNRFGDVFEPAKVS